MSLAKSSLKPSVLFNSLIAKSLALIVSPKVEVKVKNNASYKELTTILSSVTLLAERIAP